MRHLVKYTFCTAGLVLVVLWLCCLPKNLFEGVSYSTVVEDCQGELLGARIADDQQWRFPPCGSLPEKFREALVEFEDRTFYKHGGVSVRGMARAVVQNLRSGRVVSGGSTISMQVIRLSRPGRRTLWAKLRECFMATRLESRYSKEEILLMYASHAPFGGNVVGIDAAMWRYLGSDGCDISWAEAATLAVLQNAPSSITPSKNRDALLAKRNRLLRRLSEKGVISAEEYAVSVDEPLLDEPYPMPQYVPHLVDACNKDHKGAKVPTGINLQLQKQVDVVTQRWSREMRLSGASDLAAVIIDVQTGQTVAYCGNADMDFEREGKWVDAAAAPRSSGSILKPLLYASALQEGQILPHTLLDDVPTDFGGFAPKNFSGTFSGAVAADDAVARSLNVPLVAMLKAYGVTKFVKKLKDSGLSTFDNPSRDYGLSVILGGAEVTLTEITKLYAEMAACYQSEDTLRYAEFPFNDRMALYNMFEAMRKVNRPDQLDWRRVSSVQNVAWKTGTSYGSRDAWAVGLTPRYAVGVWVGNVDGSSTPGLTGARAAGPVLFDLINLLPRTEWFDAPGDDQGIDVAVCRHSGHRAGRFCAEVVYEKVSQSGAQSSVCPYCQPDHSFCLPLEVEHYYKQNHPEYRSQPSGFSMHVIQDEALKFLYPNDGSVVKIPRLMDGNIGTITVSVAHVDSAAELFWHCGSSYLGSTRDLHSMSVSLDPGTHTFTVVDASGKKASVTFSVK